MSAFERTLTKIACRIVLTQILLLSAILTMASCRYVTGIKLSQMTVATLVGLTFFQPVSYTRMAYLTYQYDI